MWQKLLAVIGASVAASAMPAYAELYFSEYIEGSSNNKALEIFNPDGQAVNLSGYRIEMYFNGSSTSTLGINLTGSVAPGGVFVLAQANAVAAITGKANQVSSSNWYNGDDAIVLKKNGQIIDSIGQIGVDPGAEWGTGLTSTADNTLRRKSQINAGDTQATDTFNPSEQWEGFAQDSFDNLGSYNGSNGSGNNGNNLAACGSAFSAIHSLQGSGNSSPLLDTAVQTEGVVIGSWQAAGQLGGFFIQAADTEADSNASTSEGIFVASSTQVALGDRVRVAGTVKETFGLTQIQAQALSICSSQTSLPQAQLINLPLNTLAQFEALEAMRVATSQPLTVNETYTLGRFGQVLLANGRLYQPTHLALPGAAAAAIAASNTLNQILLDDGSNVQNPDPVIFPAPGLSAANTLRSGDQMTDIVGVLSFDFGAYRILPTQVPSVIASNPRSEQAPSIAGTNLRVASFNLLNFFNGDGAGGGFPTARGASNSLELLRQKAKLLSALAGLNADVVGVLEIENDGYSSSSALAELTRELSAFTGQPWQFINPGVTKIGTDEIAPGIIYRSDRVRPIGRAAILNSAVDARFIDTKNRPALAQSFQLISTGAAITVNVNHFKSKGSDCNDLGDPDTLDGQGNCAKTRLQAAQALSDWLATHPTGINDADHLILGDLNSYAKEDSIRHLTAAGFTDLIAEYEGEAGYSYVFNGQAGYLDYALASTSLSAQTLSAHTWHINADEPLALDYNLEFKSAGQQLSFYAPDAYRSSDHDPLVVSIKLVADLDGDGDVDRMDVGLISAARNTQVIGFDRRDINGDGFINLTDARLLALQCTRLNCAPF
jgi:uncharacterized protein